MQYIKEEIKKYIGYEFPENVEFVKTGNALRIVATKEKTTVFYSAVRHIVRAALLMKSHTADTEYIIEEQSFLEDVCLLVDCSRNAVLAVQAAKKLICIAASLGYTSLMLGTADTYEVNNEPEFGYLRSRYTKADMKELNNYANNVGIELIPCIQTLAHLKELNRYYKEYLSLFDIDDILMCGNERVYQLFENIFATLAECYTTRRIHIGMDEAGHLGRGQYFTKNGYRTPFDILTEHLNVVSEIAKKYGFSLIMWSDTFMRVVREANPSLDENGKIVLPPEMLAKYQKMFLYVIGITPR